MPLPNQGLGNIKVITPPPLTGSVITWTKPKIIHRSFRVPTGVTLIIQDTAYCERRVLVEKGSTLNINGGVITNGCGDFWDGIELCCDNTKNQFTNSAGTIDQVEVSMSNNAVIEYARMAITTAPTSSNPTGWGSMTGGIIQADNSIFRNCKRVAEFLSYRNFNSSNPSITMDNVSYFRSCHFINDENYIDNGQDYFYAFITMCDVIGIKIEGCTFEIRTLM